MNGFLLINKAVGATSYDCIRVLKRVLKRKIKIGHAGTLDDFAEGLLIVCIGRQATRMVPHLMSCDKEYVVKARLGERTDSLDLTGKVLAVQHDVQAHKEQLKRAIALLGSSYVQVPPVYSALKYEGKPLYQLARHKLAPYQLLEQVVQKKARTIQVHSCDVLHTNGSFFSLKTRVSKGAYIRSLANDVAQKIGFFATTHELIRTKVGPFELKHAITMECIAASEDVEKHLLSVDEFKKMLNLSMVC